MRVSSKRYDCAFCINKATPLCELCTRITTPSGKESKPTYYIAEGKTVNAGDVEGFIDRITTDMETENLANQLVHHLLSRVPLPARLVLAYNRKTEREE